MALTSFAVCKLVTLINSKGNMLFASVLNTTLLDRSRRFLTGYGPSHMRKMNHLRLAIYGVMNPVQRFLVPRFKAQQDNFLYLAAQVK